MYPVYLGEPLIFFFFLSKYLCKYKRGHLIRLLISKYFSINFNVSILFQTCHPLYIFMYTYSVRNFSLNLRVFNQLRVKYKVGGSCGGVGGLVWEIRFTIDHPPYDRFTVSRCLSILRTNINVNRSDIIIIFKRIFEYLFALQRGGMCISYTSDTLWLISGLFV